MDRADRTISQQLTWSRSVQPPEPASIEWTLEFIDRSGDIFGNFTKRRRWHEGPRETYTWSSERKPTQSSTGSINCRLATGSWSYRYLTAAVFLLTTMAFFLSSSRGRRLFLRRSVRSFNADAGGATVESQSAAWKRECQPSLRHYPSQQHQSVFCSAVINLLPDIADSR